MRPSLDKPPRSNLRVTSSFRPPLRLSNNAGTVLADVMGKGNFVCERCIRAKELHFNSRQSATLHSSLHGRFQCISNQASLREKEECTNPGKYGP
jgi:hypothetical protein